MLTQNLNLRLRKDTVDKLSKIAKSSSTLTDSSVSTSVIIRRAIYDLLLKFQSDPDYRTDVLKNSKEWVKSLDTLVVHDITDDRQKDLEKARELYKDLIDEFGDLR